MTYKVIRFFTDLQDNDFPYSVGDTYPRQGGTTTEKRISELSGSNNKQGQPLIMLVEEEGGEKKTARKPAAKRATKKTAAK